MDFASGVWRLATPIFLVAIPATLLSTPVGILLLVLGVATLWFHRDPQRTIEEGIVSPADGTVSVVRKEGNRLRVGVFMSPFVVHVNRAPCNGPVASVEHILGAYRPAFSKDSERNERVRITGDDWTLVLIAGWFARRIHTYVEPGADLDRGQRVGHISYGSRADVIMPESVTNEDLLVSRGDTVRAGETLAHRQ